MKNIKYILSIVLITTLMYSCVSTYQNPTTSSQPYTPTYTPKKRLDIVAIPIERSNYSVRLDRGNEYLTFEDEKFKIVVNNNKSIATLRDAFGISIYNKTSNILSFYEHNVSLYGSYEADPNNNVQWSKILLLSADVAYRRMGDVFPRDAFLFSSDIKQNEQYAGYVFIPYEISPDYKMYKLQLELKDENVYFLYISKWADNSKIAV